MMKTYQCTDDDACGISIYISDGSDPLLIGKPCALDDYLPIRTKRLMKSLITFIRIAFN